MIQSYDAVSYTHLEEKKIVEHNYEDRIGHGTSICSTILSHVDDVEIKVFKVTSEEDEYIDCDVLISVLDYIEKNEKADIINMSICVCATKYKKEMYKMCRRLYEKGTLVVCLLYTSFELFSKQAENYK